MTFGGSGLDRAAHLRGDAAVMAEYFAAAQARVVLFWRQKPLVVASGATVQLALLPSDHPLIAAASTDKIFLGLRDGAAIFAVELLGWDPELPEEGAVSGFFDPSEQQHPDLPVGQVFADLKLVMAQLSPRGAELAATAKALWSWHDSHQFCARCGSSSDMVMAGWQRTCPICNGMHFPRTDPVVIMLITHGNSVLLGRSSFWPEGMYSLLAGFVEPGEPIEAAVRREVFEESGVRVGAVSYLSSQPWPYPSSLMFGCHGVALTTDITIDPVELEDALWITREEAAQMMAGNHPLIKASRNGSIAHFLLRNWLADSLD